MSTKRTELLSMARRLFAEEGFHAVGVDRLRHETGISKRTMYKYFPTKDALIDAVLKTYIEDVQGAFAAMRSAGTPAEQVVKLFATIRSFLGTPGMYGCLTVRAMAEFGGTGLAIETSCQDFKRWERAEFEDMAVRMGAGDPARLALRLLIIYEGMFAYAQVMRTAPPEEVVDWVSELVRGAGDT